MSQLPRIILASGSAIRAQILRNAGVPFEAIKPNVDEDIIKRQSMKDGVTLEELAMKLAEAKCLAVAARESGLVIGSDQILEFEERRFGKPANMDEARTRLMEMQGAAHSLINAVVVARDGDVIWRGLDRPRLTMREMSAEEVDAYLKAAGPDILSSVGAYQVENFGARLFDKIEGDYFAVLGLSLFPLLNVLRREGALRF